LPGHFSQILGDSAEDDLYALAIVMGYNVIRRRNLDPGIDFIANFSGQVFENATLLKPPFSPPGATAFSVKSGDFSQRDLEELVNYVARCANSNDPTLKTILGGVLVSGVIKSVGQINSILSQNVYCWDARRLIFYSVKAKKVESNSELGPVREHPLSVPLKGGFMFTIHEMSSTTIDAIADVFVDDHNQDIQGDHISSILSRIHDVAVSPVVQSTQRNVRLKLSLHALGPIQRPIAEAAYERYRREAPSTLLLYPTTELELQSYATGPWTAIFRT